MEDGGKGKGQSGEQVVPWALLSRGSLRNCICLFDDNYSRRLPGRGNSPLPEPDRIDGAARQLFHGIIRLRPYDHVRIR